MFLLVCCYIADLIFGDPEWFPHPVRIMGKLIDFLDNRLRGKGSKWEERIKGAVLASVVVGLSAWVAYLLIESTRELNPFFGNLVWIYLGYTTLSVKDLQVKAKAILETLKRGTLTSARRELSRIVGRDTENLSKDRVTVATIESIAEGINDGIIAPLFYLILGGPVWALAHKSISTLDSMVGYKNEKYLHFGWFSARLDDIANFIPARISGLLIALSSFIVGCVFSLSGQEAIGVKQSQGGIVSLAFGFFTAAPLRKLSRSFKIMFRDGGKHPSPNSGIPEAAMAGALGIRLGGVWSYQGRISRKPYLGEERRILQYSLIDEALAISLVASVLMLSMGITLKWLI